jgi:hypothetical protein
MRCASIKTLIEHTLINNEQHNMSKQVILSLLAQGNNGNEILDILDVIVSDLQNDSEGEGSDA